MKKEIRIIKRITAFCLCFAITISGGLFNIGLRQVQAGVVRAEDTVKVSNLALVNDRSRIRAVPYVTYEMNGISYDSRKTDTNLNMLMWRSLGTSARTKVADHMFAPIIPVLPCGPRNPVYLTRTFGSFGAEEIKDWYYEQTGWKRAWQYCRDKVENKYCSELEPYYSDKAYAEILKDLTYEDIPGSGFYEVVNSEAPYAKEWQDKFKSIEFFMETGKENYDAVIVIRNQCREASVKAITGWTIQQMQSMVCGLVRPTLNMSTGSWGTSEATGLYTNFWTLINETRACYNLIRYYFGLDYNNETMTDEIYGSAGISATTPKDAAQMINSVGQLAEYDYRLADFCYKRAKENREECEHTWQPIYERMMREKGKWDEEAQKLVEKSKAIDKKLDDINESGKTDLKIIPAMSAVIEAYPGPAPEKGENEADEAYLIRWNKWKEAFDTWNTNVKEASEHQCSVIDKDMADWKRNAAECRAEAVEEYGLEESDEIRGYFSEPEGSEFYSIYVSGYMLEYAPEEQTTVEELKWIEQDSERVNSYYNELIGKQETLISTADSIVDDSLTEWSYIRIKYDTLNYYVSEAIKLGATQFVYADMNEKEREAKEVINDIKTLTAYVNTNSITELNNKIDKINTNLEVTKTNNKTYKAELQRTYNEYLDNVYEYMNAWNAYISLDSEQKQFVHALPSYVKNQTAMKVGPDSYMLTVYSDSELYKLIHDQNMDDMNEYYKKVSAATREYYEILNPYLDIYDEYNEARNALMEVVHREEEMLDGYCASYFKGRAWSADERDSDELYGEYEEYLNRYGIDTSGWIDYSELKEEYGQKDPELTEDDKRIGETLRVIVEDLHGDGSYHREILERFEYLKRQEPVIRRKIKSGADWGEEIYPVYLKPIDDILWGVLVKMPGYSITLDTIRAGYADEICIQDEMATWPDNNGHYGLTARLYDLYLRVNEDNDYYIPVDHISKKGNFNNISNDSYGDETGADAESYFDVELGVSKTALLGVEVYPENATYKDIVWTSEDEAVVTVDNYGQIKGIKPGNAVIKAFSADTPSEPQYDEEGGITGYQCDSSYCVEFNVKITENSSIQDDDIDNPYDHGDVQDEDWPDDNIIPHGIWCGGICDKEYTGSKVAQSFRVYDGEKLLNEKVDYTVSYKNNINVYTIAKDEPGFDPKKAPSVTVTGKGNYDSKETVYFKILPPNISGEYFSADDMTLAETGKKQTIKPVLYWKDKALKNKTDYTFNIYAASDTEFKIPLGQAVTDMGDYVLRFSGSGNFTGTRDIKLKLTSEGTLVSKMKIKKISAAVWTGAPITPEPEVLDGKIPLEKGKHYSLSYASNVDPGTGYVIITGNPENGYAGSRRVSFKITAPKSSKAGAYDISEAKDTDKRISIDYDKTVLFMKGGAKPVITVTFKIGDDKFKKLVEGRDYRVSYKNNKAYGGGRTPIAVVSGTGNFKGKRELPFVIEEKPLDNVVLLADDKPFKNKANSYTTKVTLTDEDEKNLSSGKDYEKDIKYTYVEDTVVTVNGAELTRKKGEAVDKQDIIPANTVIRVTATAKAGSGYTGTISGTYRIIKANISSAKVTIPPQVYTGKRITLSENDIKVVIKGKRLQADDYEIAGYANNINKGTAKVILRGTGNYGGLKTQTFKIKAKGFRWWSK